MLNDIPGKPYDIVCKESSLPEFPGLLFGIANDNGLMYFNASAYLRSIGNDLLKLPDFIRLYEPLIKAVQKTYNILLSTESFFSKINLHIIQCDATIQEDAVIHSQEEFDKYLEQMKIRGLGGTDFRPVFSYVEWLIEKKEFNNLKGLIYFTDGYGTFPERKPPYETAFVFVEDNYNNPDVPPWAIKLVLQKDEI